MQALQKLVAQYNQGNFSGAKQTGLKLLKKDKNNFDALQIIALSEKALGSFTASEHYFKKCLLANNSDARVYANYADLLVDMDRKYEALDLYQSSISLNNQVAPVLFNYANLLYSFERYEQAKAIIDNAIAIQPNYAKAYLLLGEILNSMEHPQEALLAFDQAKKIGVNRNTVLTHTVAVHRFNNDAAKAIELFNVNGSNLQLNDPELLFQKACAFYDLGQHEKCEELLKKTLALNPDMTKAHESLNNMYWERANADKFLASYIEIPQQPLSYELTLSYLSQLILSERNTDALEIVNAALKKFGNTPHLLQFKAVLFSKNGELEDAEKFYRKALELSPYSIRLLIDNASLCIRAEQYKQADKYLDKAGTINPIDQEVWAYKGLSWRLQEDERFEWLTSYEVLVKEYELNVPTGYDDFEHFLNELKEISKQLHISDRQPLDQSVIGGTQTIGRFLSRKEKVIQAYREMLDINVRDYLANLPTDDTHPFLSRNTKLYAYNGSWSVRLKRGGYHSNHVHPVGWLSNCTYISIPEIIQETDESKAGWIKFGESSLGLGERESIDRIICPKPGKHVLFPSYLWHGTVPFESDDYRITIPNDIRPIILP